MRNKLMEYGLVATMTSLLWISIAMTKEHRERCRHMNIPDVSEIQQPTDIDKLVEAFIYVESRGDDSAVHPKSKATGCLQVMPILIHDANRIIGHDKYQLSDRNNREKSKEIFLVIMNHYNPDFDINLAAKIWNPRSRVSYHLAIMKKYNELINER